MPVIAAVLQVLLARAAKFIRGSHSSDDGPCRKTRPRARGCSSFPDQTPVDRTTLNSFEDPRAVEWVKKTGKKKRVMDGLWTESCLPYGFTVGSTCWLVKCDGALDLRTSTSNTIAIIGGSQSQRISLLKSVSPDTGAGEKKYREFGDRCQQWHYSSFAPLKLKNLREQRG